MVTHPLPPHPSLSALPHPSASIPNDGPTRKPFEKDPVSLLSLSRHLTISII